jgi:hypothetical protein
MEHGNIVTIANEKRWIRITHLRSKCSLKIYVNGVMDMGQDQAQEERWAEPVKMFRWIPYAVPS